MATRTRSDIEADIAAARARLAGNVEDLITAVHPQAVKTRAINDAKDFAAQELNTARSQFVDDFGNYKWDRIAYLAAAVLGTVALVAVLRSVVRR
nr:DUF3618 domain-containing protein [Propionibacterium sp.]